jgi:hypothetical protein
MQKICEIYPAERTKISLQMEAINSAKSLGEIYPTAKFHRKTKNREIFGFFFISPIK